MLSYSLEHEIGLIADLDKVISRVNSALDANRAELTATLTLTKYVEPDNDESFVSIYRFPDF